MTRASAGLAVAVVVLTLASAAGAQSGPTLLANGDRLLVMPPRRAVRTNAPRATLPVPLPAHPWTLPPRVNLHGGVTTALLPLPDGTLVAGLSVPHAPHAIAWIEPSGELRRTAPVDDRPEGDLSLGADGRIYATAANRVYTLAPDGTTRATLQLPSVSFGGVIVRDDGTAAVVTNPNTAAGEILVLGPSGESLGTRPLPAPVVGRPLLGPDGCLWIPLSTGIVCAGESGQLGRATFGRGAGIIAVLGRDAVAAVVGTELQFFSADGAVRGRVDVGPNVQWLSALPNGGVALFRGGPTQELWLVGPDGTVSDRIPSTVQWLEGPLTDPTGALLLAARTGDLAVIEPDGTERWRMSIQVPITRAPVPLAGGGVAVTTSSGNVLFLQ